MWTLYSKTPEHWVPISIVASFNRMRALLPNESGGVPWIAAQIRERSTELEVDETGENVRRNTEPRPPTNVFDRSVYAKGFGFDEKDGLLLTEIQAFLGKWGKVNVVRMRRDNDKKFKVSFDIGMSGLLHAEPIPARSYLVIHICRV
jgi:lupus La protein